MKCLLLIDLQNDFMPNGNLAVEAGDEVVEVANSIMSKFDLVVATLDYHPHDHASFASNNGVRIGEIIELNDVPQIMWPDHCVQGALGAELHKDLKKNLIHKQIHKGNLREIDSYSGFFDNERLNQTELDSYLKSKGVTELYLMGLATDYCVKFTVLDALDLGYKTYVIKEGCRGVNLNPDDSEKAFSEMEAKGANLISVEAIG